MSNYYQKKAARRKRYQENRKEHVRQAEERLLTSQNDYPAAGRVGDQGNVVMQQKHDHTSVTNIPPNTWSQLQIDKTSMSTTSQGPPPQSADRPQPLAASILAIAATLDGEQGNKRRRTDNPSSGSGVQKHQWVTLNGPFWGTEQLQATPDRIPEQPVMKCFPQPRTAGYKRLIPKLNGRYIGGHKDIQPPFGIQLIESFRLWRDSCWKNQT